MRKNHASWLLQILGIAACVLLLVTVGSMAKSECVTIPGGTIFTSTGEVITTGYDEFGYNYQAHIFNGRYCDYDRVIGGEYCDDTLVMKWNDAWLSNKDCDGDEKLDRHFGYDSYIGSGAWCTNHQSGTYIGDDGKEHKWTYFVKIVAKPTVDYDCAAHGGEQIWGAFCIIQSVYNDPYGGYHGLELKAARPGLGNW